MTDYADLIRRLDAVYPSEDHGPLGHEASRAIRDLQAQLSSGSFYQEKDIDAMQAKIAALEAQRATARADAIREAAKAVSFAAWKHDGHDGYSQGLDAGARHQNKEDYAAILALLDRAPKAQPTPPASDRKEVMPNAPDGSTCRDHATSPGVTAGATPPETFASIYADLAAKQEPLGSEFDAAIEAGLPGLYEDGPLPPTPPAMRPEANHPELCLWCKGTGHIWGTPCGFCREPDGAPRPGAETWADTHARLGAPADPYRRHGSTQRMPRVKPGLYEVKWKAGGSSVSSIGCSSSGDNWIAPSNWIAPAMIREMEEDGCWGGIEALVSITPPADPVADAVMVPRAMLLDCARWFDRAEFQGVQGVPDYGATLRALAGCQP